MSFKKALFKKTELNALDLVFAKSPNIYYELNPNKLVAIISKQDKPIQRLLRKLGLKIPLKTTIELDKYCSFIFLQIDGEKKVGELYDSFIAEFGEGLGPIDRLLQLLAHLEKNAKYIHMVENDDKHY